jgi:hypothetical protein
MNGLLKQGNIEMRFKTIGKLCVVSFVVSIGSPLLAAPARHDAYDSSCEQQSDVRHHPRFTACTASEHCGPRCNIPSAHRDDWPAGMILG